MSSYNEFWKLREIIVGDVHNFNLDKLERTFQVGYGENMKNVKMQELWIDPNLNYYSYVDYKVDEWKTTERREDLINLAKLFEELWVHVKRPDSLNKVQTFKTPEFAGVLTPVSNPRDRVFVYGKNIIETPCMIRKRYFENQLLYWIFQEYTNDGYIWISAPNPPMKNERFDFDYWLDDRDFAGFDENAYDIAFDAAQLLRIGKDILFNITSYNHELWARWMQRLLDRLEPGAKVHKLYRLDDNHIDGVLSVLRPGTFLVNNDYGKRTYLKNIKDYLPEKFKNWEVIFMGDSEENNENLKKKLAPLDSKTTTYLQLCSIRGSFTNVLSIDENTVMVNEDATNTIRILEDKGFKVVPVRLRHCELYGGGIHCATLDTKRDGDFIEY